MLQHCVLQWGNVGYRLYVGCYANDDATIAAASSFQDPKIRLVIGATHGPTTKAGCLNVLYRAMVDDEERSGTRFEAVLLHDAEDLVHPDELRVHAALGERFSLIQIPVLPLRQPGSRWVSGHYLDEFAEAHSRDMVVREAIGAALPSAGVGCSIRRSALADIAASRGGLPFAEDSLTEDYELGLRLGELGLTSAFVRIADSNGRIVATQAHFPATLPAAVRQKNRWTIGIALAGWDRVGWRGNIFECWMRLRDRRAPLAAMLLLCAYGALVLTPPCCSPSLGANGLSDTLSALYWP
jgi:adsorption protein B